MSAKQFLNMYNTRIGKFHNIYIERFNVSANNLMYYSIDNIKEIVKCIYSLENLINYAYVIVENDKFCYNLRKRDLIYWDVGEFVVLTNTSISSIKMCFEIDNRLHFDIMDSIDEYDIFEMDSTNIMHDYLGSIEYNIKTFLRHLDSHCELLREFINCKTFEEKMNMIEC